MKEFKGYTPEKMLTHEEDKRLVRLALSGDQQSYNSLLQKYKPILFTAAKRRLPDASLEDLEDTVMIVLGSAFVKLNQYDPEKSKLFTWMLACLHNYVNSIPKQKKRINAKSLDDVYRITEDGPIEYEIPDEDNFSDDYDNQRSFALLKTVMKRLPPDLYQVVFLKFFKEYTHQEIADEMGIDKTLIFYKIKKAKEILKKYSDRYGIF